LFLPLYLFSLTVSSGLIGAFAHRMLAEQGFVPDLNSGMLFAAGVAAVFAALQLGYMALLYLVAPARGGAPLAAEAVSQLTAIVMIPCLLHLPVPWPHPKIAEFEELVYLAAFLGLHGACKLVALFAATQSRATTRLVVLAWAAGATLCASTAQGLLLEFRGTLVGLSHDELPAPQPSSVDQAHAESRLLTEGRLYTFPLENPLGKQQTFYLAFAESESEAPAKLHLTIALDGTSSEPVVQPVDIAATGWSAFTVSPALVPADATSLQLLWSELPEPAWATRTGIRPQARSSRQLLVAGPYASAPRVASTPPSLVLIAIDGMGARRMSGSGYERATTPRLDAWAKSASQFQQSYTPSPDPVPAYMSLLTAQPPLKHGYIEKHRGPLPADVTTLAEEFAKLGYATAALTEGVPSIKGAPFASDLAHGTGFERGFKLFDEAYPVATTLNSQGMRVPGGFEPTGAQDTLDRARAYIESHRTTPFFLFIRLRELDEPHALVRYGSAFLPESGKLTPLDLHDTALAHVDTQVGDFLDWLEDGLPENALAIGLTAPYGLDFTGGRAGRYLTEDALHVPLIIKAPSLTPRARRTLGSTMDLAPALLGLAGGKFTHPTLGTSALDAATDRAVVSAMGEPLALSLRTGTWRLTWQTGLNPRTFERMEQEQYLDFISVDRFAAGQPQQNYWQTEAALAERYRERLLEYLKSYQTPGAAP